MLFPNFFRITWQDGRLFGSLIDVLNRGAPVAILAVGMMGVIATKGVDLAVGAVMAMAGAVAATLVVAGYPAPVVVAAALCLEVHGVLAETSRDPLLRLAIGVVELTLALALTREGAHGGADYRAALARQF